MNNAPIPIPDPPTTRPSPASAILYDETANPILVAGYLIERRLGRGGMGVVYQARQTALDRVVALKMILAGGHAEEADLDRFRTEAEAIARLQHPNIVQIYEVGQQDGLPYFSLEYCSGGSLYHQLQGRTMLPMEAAKLLETLARTMHVAHEKGIVHRDLSPANVLLAEDGTPKISDFGLAKKLDEVSKTASGAVMGTPSYMAPEQAEGIKGIGPACDVYALGAILYECLTGRPPFKAATAIETLRQAIEDEPVSLRAINRRIPRDVETITLKCLQKEPGNRYKSALALAEDLRRFQVGEAICARPVGPAEHGVKWVRRNATATTAAAAVFAALLAGLVVSLWESERANQEARAARKAEGEAGDHLRIAQGEQARAEAQLERAESLVYAGKLARSQQAFRDGDVGLALQHLNECKGNLRHLEHSLLWTRFTSNQTFEGNTGWVFRAVFSPDGTCIASSGGIYGKPGVVKVWDAAKGTELFTLKGHTDLVSCVAFSPDGKRLVSGSYDKTLKVWDAETGKELGILKGHTEAVYHLAYSPDGKRIASASGSPLESAKPGEIKVWDADTGSDLFTVQEHADTVYCVAFSPDGKRLASASGDTTIKVWDAVKGTELAVLRGHIDAVTRVAYSPDGASLASASADRTIKMWDAETGKELRTLKGHVRSVFGLAYSPDGKHLVSGGGDPFNLNQPGEMKVWDALQGQELFALKGHTSMVLSVAYNPDGRRIVSAAGDRTVKVWNATLGQELLALQGDSSSVESVVFSPDGRRLASTGDWTVPVWDVTGGQKLLRLQGHGGTSVYAVAFRPDGKRLVSASNDRTARVWDADTGKELLAFKGHNSAVESVAYSPDGQRIASVASDRTVKIWDADTARELLTIPGQSAKGTEVKPAPSASDIFVGPGPVHRTARVNSVTFSPDGKHLVTARGDKTVTVWDPSTGRAVFVLEGHTDKVTNVVYSPDGTRLATASADRTARVWDATQGRELLILAGHREAMTSVVFSPDGKRILSASADQTVRVWDTTRGQELLTLKAHADKVLSVAISGDGKHLASAGQDGTIKVWGATRTQERLFFKGHTGSVRCVALSPGERWLASGGTDRTVRIWDVNRVQEAFAFKGHSSPITRVAFSVDGLQLFAWDEQQTAFAWTIHDGEPVEPVDPPAMPPPGAARSSRGSLLAEGRGNDVVVTDTGLLTPDANAWPLPDRADRQGYHGEQARLAAEQKQWFVVAFHLERLLLDQPDNASVKRRRDEALKKHAESNSVPK